MIEVKCQCGTQLALGDEWQGRKGKCPSCGSVVKIPHHAAASPAADDPDEAPPIQVPTSSSHSGIRLREKPLGDKTVVVERPDSPHRAAPPASGSPAESAEATTEIIRGGPMNWLLSHANPMSWPNYAQAAAGLFSVAIAAWVTFIAFAGKDPEAANSPPADSTSHTASASPVVPPRPKPSPRETHSAEQPPPPVTSSDPPERTDGGESSKAVADVPAAATSGASNVSEDRKIQNVDKPRPPLRKPGGLTGLSREYDDLHCQRIQAQHGVRVPQAATILEVNGVRLPISNPSELTQCTVPMLFLPRGVHAVRFRGNESPVAVTIASDLIEEYLAMRKYFDTEGTIHTQELLARSARAMDVHSAPFLLNLMGASHVAKSQWGPAERKFRRSIRVNPMFSPAHLNLAVCMLRREAREEAAREIELADAFNVQNVFGLIPAIAELRRQIGTSTTERTPLEFAATWYVISEPLSEEDRRLTALLQAMSKYAVREEERGKILNNLGVHFADTGRMELALEHYRSALAVLKTAGPERFALARQVLSHMSDGCRKAAFEEAEEYQRMQELVTP